MSERLGASVELLQGGTTMIRLSGGFSAETTDDYKTLSIALASLDDCETVRDALSAFIAFHRRVDGAS